MHGPSGKKLVKLWIPRTRNSQVRFSKADSINYCLIYVDIGFSGGVLIGALNEIAVGTTKGHMLLPMFGKLNSMKTSKKEVVAMMDFSVLDSATGKFSENNILGKGGFGCVYRACLDRGVVAAVKKLNCCRQEVEKEFEVTAKYIAILFCKVDINCELSVDCVHLWFIE
jgi:hypothetical protein